MIKISKLIFIFTVICFITACHDGSDNKLTPVQEELINIASSKEGLEKNYNKTKVEVNKTKDDYNKGPEEETAFADAQAKLIVAAAKLGKIKEAERIFRAADRSGVANDNVYFARDLAKKIAKQKNKTWFGSKID